MTKGLAKKKKREPRTSRIWGVEQKGSVARPSGQVTMGITSVKRKAQGHIKKLLLNYESALLLVSLSQRGDRIATAREVQ